MATAAFQGTHLASKIVKIMREVEHIEKRGTHDAGEFDYQTASDITHAVRVKLVEHNIALISDEQECVEGKFKIKGAEVFTARIKTLYTLIDGDSGERETFSIFAAKHSDNTPAVNACKTSSLKYALKQTFLIPDEPAPEKQVPAAEKNRAALEHVKTTVAAGNLLTIKLLSAKSQTSSNQKRDFLAVSYCLVGKPRERKYASCWIDPLKPLLAGNVGKDMLVKFGMSTEGDKVHTNFVNVFKIGEREVKDFKFVDEVNA